ncbi:Cytosolic arginine sensor for mTORC1 subunit 2 [Actinomortierella ambigua]|nr:Cytosolic arginine sensor for mTORC1 subunit 2 [Actinomortierella ambigua]
MKLVLFPTGPQHFFSYTETDTEVSLIVDESHIGGFPENTLNVCDVVWRAVQIEPGESGLGTVEVVSQVSKPLAEINVSIMQISTYDADFTLMPECDLQRALESLSKVFTISNNPLEDLGIQPSDLKTWDQSYPQSPTGISSLQDALLHTANNSTVATAKEDYRADSGVASVVHSGHGSNTTVFGNGSGSTGLDGPGAGADLDLSKLTLDPATQMSSPSSSPTSIVPPILTGPPDSSSLLLADAQAVSISSTQLPLRRRSSAMSSSPEVHHERLIRTKARHPFKVNYPYQLHITSMEQSLLDVLAIRLLESIFFDTRTDRFFSFTQTDTTLSMIMDDETLARFPDHTLNSHAGAWKLISIGDGPLGFDECGIVSEFTRPLSDAGIALFYLSTFSSDYLMVSDQEFNHAVSCLRETAESAAQEVDSLSGSPPPSHNIHDSIAFRLSQEGSRAGSLEDHMSTSYATTATTDTLSTSVSSVASTHGHPSLASEGDHDDEDGDHVVFDVEITN